VKGFGLRPVQGRRTAPAVAATSAATAELEFRTYDGREPGWGWARRSRTGANVGARVGPGWLPWSWPGGSGAALRLATPRSGVGRAVEEQGPRGGDHGELTASSDTGRQAFY